MTNWPSKSWGVDRKGDAFLQCAVDDEDRARIGKHSWHINREGYAVTWVDGRTVLMHRMVMNAPKGLHVHHRNGDLLDNRKANLEILTASDHCQLHWVERKRRARNRARRLKAEPLLMSLPLPSQRRDQVD